MVKAGVVSQGQLYAVLGSRVWGLGVWGLGFIGFRAYSLCSLLVARLTAPATNESLLWIDFRGLISWVPLYPHLGHLITLKRM